MAIIRLGVLPSADSANGYSRKVFFFGNYSPQQSPLPFGGEGQGERVLIEAPSPASFPRKRGRGE